MEKAGKSRNWFTLSEKKYRIIYKEKAKIIHNYTIWRKPPVLILVFCTYAYFSGIVQVIWYLQFCLLLFLCFPLVFIICVCVLVARLCLTLSDLMDCTLQGPSACGILWARIPEWVVIPFSRGSSWPRDRTQVSCTASRFFTHYHSDRLKQKKTR